MGTENEIQTPDASVFADYSQEAPGDVNVYREEASQPSSAPDETAGLIHVADLLIQLKAQLGSVVQTLGVVGEHTIEIAKNQQIQLRTLYQQMSENAAVMNTTREITRAAARDLTAIDQSFGAMDAAVEQMLDNLAWATVDPDLDSIEAICDECGEPIVIGEDYVKSEGLTLCAECADLAPVEEETDVTAEDTEC